MGLVPPWAEGPQGGQQGEPAPWSRGWPKAISLQEQSQAAGRFGFEDVPCSEQAQVGDGGRPWESELQKPNVGAEKARLLGLTLQGELGDKVWH